MSEEINKLWDDLYRFINCSGEINREILFPFVINGLLETSVIRRILIGIEWNETCFKLKYNNVITLMKVCWKRDYAWSAANTQADKLQKH